MKGTFPIHKFRELETPFYYYDTNLLRHTLDTIRKEAGKYNSSVYITLLRPMQILRF